MSSLSCRTATAIAVILILVWGIATSLWTPQPGHSDGHREAAIGWLRDVAIRFDDDNLSTVRDGIIQAIDGATVVTIGEVTHGTHECHALRQAIVQAAVAATGGATVVLEAPPHEVQAIDAYVRGGEGTAAEASRQLGSWIWWTEEFAGLVEWLRTLHLDGKRIRVLGMDVGVPHASAECIRRLAQSGLNTEAPRIEEHLPAILSWLEADPSSRAASQDMQVAAHCQALKEALRTADQETQEGCDHESLLISRLCANSLLHHVAIRTSDPSAISRDRTMAENVLLIAQHETVDVPVLVWAHNLHASTTEIDGWRSMGSWLRGSLGHGLVTVGSTTHAGRFNAVLLNARNQATALTDVELPSAHPEGFEASFHEVPGSFFVDLRDLPPGSKPADWFGAARPLRTIGATYGPTRPEDTLLTASIRDLFDLLFHLDSTSATRFLATRETLSTNAPIAVVNPGFERGLTGWVLSGTEPERYSLEAVPREDASGRCAVLSSSSSQGGSGNIKQAIAAADVRGTTVRLSASLRTSGVEEWAGLWLVALSSSGMLAMNTMSDSPVRGDHPWTDVEILLEIPESAKTLMLGLSLYGRGTVWIDDVVLEAAGEHPQDDA